MRVLSKDQAERLFSGGELSPHEDAETRKIKTERRQRAAIKRHVPTQLSETACMGNGRKAHELFKWAEHDAPGEVNHVVRDGCVTVTGGCVSNYLEVCRIERQYNDK